MSRSQSTPTERGGYSAYVYWGLNVKVHYL
jgi:hypothetical protein